LLREVGQYGFGAVLETEPTVAITDKCVIFCNIGLSGNDTLQAINEGFVVVLRIY
jgi:hypothetical protein